MLEFIFVIIVIGILAVTIIPRMKGSPVQECAVDLLSQIRYTQHLAIIDDKYNSNTATWFKNRWQIRFNGNKYTVTSDNNTTPATNPSDNNSTFSNIDLHAKYNITLSITGRECATTAGASGIHIISFDHIGRPITGDLSNATQAYSRTNPKLLNSDDCNIVISNGDENATINIAPETGYTHITYN